MVKIPAYLYTHVMFLFSRIINLSCYVYYKFSYRFSIRSVIAILFIINGLFSDSNYSTYSNLTNSHGVYCSDNNLQAIPQM